MSDMSWFEQRAGLDGTVAVVTGGAGGLGAAIVEDLAANGVRPAVIDLDDAAVKELRDVLDKQGVDHIVTQGDARDPDALTALFEQVDERWGRVDTLVNIVGGTFRAQFVDTGAKGWDAILRTNLSHVLHACSLAVPRMQAGGRGGSIINLTTIEAHRAAPGFAVYSAAKAAVEQFARTLSIEVAPDGIRVNNVAPDYVPTPNLAKLASLGGGDSSLSTPEGSASRSRWVGPGTSPMCRTVWCSWRRSCRRSSPAPHCTRTAGPSHRRDGSTGPIPGGRTMFRPGSWPTQPWPTQPRRSRDAGSGCGLHSDPRAVSADQIGHVLESFRAQQ